jgi:uncharacterized protein (TIGR02246 family)
MKQALTTITALALCAGLAACDRNKAGGGAAAPADTKAAEQAVKDAEAATLAEWKAKKADGVAGHYASDATTYLAGQAPMVGRDKIQAGVGQFMQDANFGIDYANTQTIVAASGDLAYTKGTYHVTYTDPQTKKAKSEAGNYVTIFHKEADGSWKAVEDAAVPGAAPTAG